MQVGLKYHHFLLARHNGAYVHHSESVLDGSIDHHRFRFQSFKTVPRGGLRGEPCGWTSQAVVSGVVIALEICLMCMRSLIVACFDLAIRSN